MTGFGTFVAFSALDYGLSAMAGEGASFMKSVASGVIWNLLGRAAPAATMFLVGSELFSMASDLARYRRGERAALRWAHAPGGDFYHTRSTWHLQEEGLRRLMNNRRALGMGLGSEASFLHRAW